MLPIADKEVLREFEPLAFTCWPEAPWIVRCKYGIKFTEEIQDEGRIQLDDTGKSRVVDGRVEEERYIFMPKDKYKKYKQRKCRVKIKASSDGETSLSRLMDCTNQQNS